MPKLMHVRDCEKIAGIKADFVVTRGKLVYLCEAKIHRPEIAQSLQKANNMHQLRALAKKFALEI